MKKKKQIVVLTGFVKYQNKILMIQRDEPECPGAHLKWELPGGKISFDEESEKTIVREITEETGYLVRAIDLAPIIRTHTWNYPAFIQHTIVLCYICKFISGKVSKLDHHTKDVAWFDYNEIKWQNTLIGTRELINASLKNKL